LVDEVRAPLGHGEANSEVSLSCTRTISYTASGNSSDVDDLVAWVDLFNFRVLNPDLVTISDKDSFHASDNEIRFSMTRKGYTMAYTVNRISGSLTASVTENGKNAALITGECKKMEALVRKF
jgi:hypothetical protein